jgi:hypothetical protein
MSKNQTYSLADLAMARAMRQVGAMTILVTRLAVLGVTAAWVGLAATPSFAQQGGTPAENAACRPDVVRLCRAAAPDTGRVLACLQANRARLSRGCRAVLEGHGR